MLNLLFGELIQTFFLIGQQISRLNFQQEDILKVNKDLKLFFFLNI